MESNGNHGAKDERSDDAAKSKDKTPAGTATASTATATTTSPNNANNDNSPEAHQKSPRKRRKVNHGMLCSSTTWSINSPNTPIPP